MTLDQAISVLRPGAQWTLRGNSLEGLLWHDAQPIPTQSEIDACIAQSSVPSEKDYGVAIQKAIDQTAHARGYLDAVTCASYDGDPNAAWDADAKAFKIWRSSVWQFAYSALAAVTSGQQQPPSIDAFVASLPSMKWLS